jgi:hypothetical protein
MPVPGSRKLLVWLLALAIGHAPAPLMHSHELLSDEQLEAHLDFFHPDADKNLPLGWHLHQFCVGLNYHIPQDGLGADRESDASRRHSCENQPHRSLCWHTKHSYACPIARPDSGVLVFDLRSRQQYRVPLYELYCSLLI